MVDLLARYLDGELDEREAEEFLAAVERDRELAARLLEHEQMLAQAVGTPRTGVSPNFTNEVMARIERLGTPTLVKNLRRTGFPAWRGLALAASLVTAFGLGAFLTRLDRVPGGGSPGIPEPLALVQGQMLPATARPAEEGFRLVRLVYNPQNSHPRQVSVVGDFNDWDPTRTPMQKDDGQYLVFLMVPPGSHEYLFVEDGENWVTDPLARQTRDDGFGNRNAVMDIEL